MQAVYIGVVTTAHLEVVRTLLAAGKNLLCEKPLALNLKDAQEIIGLAKQKGVFFMEAMWARCHPAYR